MNKKTDMSKTNESKESKYSIRYKEWRSSKGKKARTMDNIRMLNEQILYLHDQAGNMPAQENAINENWWGVFETETKRTVESVDSLRTLFYLRSHPNYK